MPIPEVYKPVIEKLKTGTWNHKLNWQESPQKDQFFVSLDDASLFITQVVNLESASALMRSVLTPARPKLLGEFVSFKIVDDKGATVDQFSLEQKDSDFASAAELFDAARRSALRVDERVAKISNQLDKLLGSSRSELVPSGR
jgi:hypothetical protein